MSGGYIGDGFRTVGNLDAEFRGGQIDGGISVTQNSLNPSELSVTGGVFDTYNGNWLLEFSDAHRYGNWTGFSTLDIAGGQFGYASAGNGLFFDEWVNFNIYGRDLIYSDGWLTGYLQDGNWFNNQLTFGSNWRGTLRFTTCLSPALGPCLLQV